MMTEGFLIACHDAVSLIFSILDRLHKISIALVYTLDRRDFSIIRPKHCDYFDLLP